MKTCGRSPYQEGEVMVRGFYEAASGVLATQKSFNVVANNIANVGTSGFKAEGTVGSSFAEHLVARIGGGNIFPSRNIGPGSFFTVNIIEYTDFAQGSIENTDRELDMAINGNGYFIVRSDTLGDVLTRNGQFDVDSEMQLVLPGVGLVLDDGGSPITLESSTFEVNADGAILVGDEEVGRVGVFSVSDESSMINAGRGFYFSSETPETATIGSYMVVQGALEKSNVNMAMEMSRVMSGQNMFNACAQIVKMYDSLNEVLVTQIGKVS